MKKHIYHIISFCTVIILLPFAACNDDEIIDKWKEDNPIVEPAGSSTPSSGTLDFGHYVSLGNSLTAGYADGALHTSAQTHSYPAQLAAQFQLAGGGDFNQPDINSVNGYNSTFSDPKNGIIKGKIILNLKDQDNPSFDPTDGELPKPYAGDKGALNNFGVPGIVTAQLLTPATGTPGSPYLNPLYQRFATNPGTSTILGDALATNPTFFSLWVGANDVLGYASTGGASFPITPSEDFTEQFQMIIDQLKGKPGVVLNVPPVLLTPFFLLVDYNAIPLDDVKTLNEKLKPVNAAILSTRFFGAKEDLKQRLFSYNQGQNPVLVADPSLEDLGPYFDIMRQLGTIGSDAERAALVPYEQSRQLVKGEIILLSAAPQLGKEADGDNSVKDTPIGVVIPLGLDLKTGSIAKANSLYLSLAEIKAINDAILAYNTAIKTIIDTENSKGADIALVDVTPTFYDLFGLSDGEVGLRTEDFLFTPDFTPNTGLFSTDGIHPNPRGHAIITNKIIDAINARWKATIPHTSVLGKSGILFITN